MAIERFSYFFSGSIGYPALSPFTKRTANCVNDTTLENTIRHQDSQKMGKRPKIIPLVSVALGGWSAAG